MNNVFGFPVEPKLKALDTRIRALLEIYQHSDDKNLQKQLLTMSAMVFILGGDKEAPDFNKFLAEVEEDLNLIEIASKRLVP